jgi:hypothetical protein
MQRTTGFATEWSSVARHLIIVSPEEPALYGYLIERFSDDANVRVIVDRRSGEDRRRRPAERSLSVVDMRRRRERRASGAIDDQLRTQKHVVVTLADIAAQP